MIPLATAPPRALLIATLLAAVAFGLLAMTICLPSMPGWAGVFDVAQGRVQLTFSAFVLTYGGAQIVYGPLSDRHGRKRLLLFGLALAALGSALCALAPGLDTLIAGRALQGAGAAAGMVIGRAMVQDHFSGPERPRMMAYTGMVMGLCPPSATLLGGQLHEHFGWRAGFVAITVLALALVVLTWRVLPANRPRADEVRAHWLREMVGAYRELARRRVFLGYAVILAMCTGSFYVFLAGAPLVLASYGVGPGRIGWFIMAVPLSYIAGNFTVSRLLAVTSESRLALTGQASACLGAALVLLLALGGLHTPLALALPLTLLGFGHGLLMPSTLSGTIGVIPALAGSAVAASGLGQQLFGAVGGWAVGLAHHRHAAPMAAMMLVCMSVSLLAQVLVIRWRRMAG